MFNLYRFYSLLLLICAIDIKRTFGSVNCRDDYTTWQCDSCDECIDYYNRCDGIINCRDGSDETVKNCIQKETTCTHLHFKCTYGACVFPRVVCDGKKDCADGSDELEALCSTESWKRKLKGNCSDNQIQCGSDNECILSDKKCDGVRDCKNGYDETLEICSTQKCYIDSFQCGYGACIDGKAVCNGITDCIDGSDESPKMCIKQRNKCNERSTRSISSASCFLPPLSNVIATKLFTNENFNLNSDVPVNTILKFACNPGFLLKGSITSTCKADGRWSNPLPKCSGYLEP